MEAYILCRKPLFRSPGAYLPALPGISIAVMMSFGFSLVFCSFCENSALENEAFTAFSVATSAFPVNSAVLLARKWTV